MALARRKGHELAGARDEAVAAGFDLDLAGDDRHPRALANLVLAHLLTGRDAQEDGTGAFAGEEHLGGADSVGRRYSGQVPALHPGTVPGRDGSLGLMSWMPSTGTVAEGASRLGSR